MDEVSYSGYARADDGPPWTWGEMTLRITAEADGTHRTSVEHHLPGESEGVCEFCGLRCCWCDEEFEEGLHGGRT